MGFYTDWIVPWLNEQMSRGPEVQALRRDILSTLSGNGLEIGFGTGLSLAFYPATVTKLYVLDPARETLKRTRKRIDAAPVPVTRLEYSGKGPYPLASASVDFVASMLTLCTIPDVDAALHEIRRVLKPSGRFVFFEHGAAEEPKIQKPQNRLNRFQNIVAGGCNLNRRIDELLARAGFSRVDMSRVPIPKAPKYMGRAYRGVAYQN